MGRVIRILVLLEEPKLLLSLLIPNHPIILTLHASKVLPIRHRHTGKFQLPQKSF
jgi:hypothetical protein